MRTDGQSSEHNLNARDEPIARSTTDNPMVEPIVNYWSRFEESRRSDTHFAWTVVSSGNSDPPNSGNSGTPKNLKKD